MPLGEISVKVERGQCELVNQDMPFPMEVSQYASCERENTTSINLLV